MTIAQGDLSRVIRAQLLVGGTISSQMGAVIDAAQRKQSHDDWSKFRAIRFDRTALLRKWLTHRLSVEPPQTPVAGWWFGLCHTSHGSKTVDLYLSASTRFVSNDRKFRWAREPEYRPDYCYARSDALWKIYQRAHRKPGGLKESAERALSLAYAAFVVARLMSELDPQLFLYQRESAGVAVGFDDGDAILLGEISSQGFRLSKDAKVGDRESRQQRQAQPEKLTDLDSFWNLIADTMATTKGDLDAFEKRLTRNLAGRSAKEILAFAGHFRELLEQTCNWEVYGAAAILGCDSEDSFLDFRRWLIFQGRRQFTRILNDPDFLGIYDPGSDPIEQWYTEFHPLQVYEKATGKNRSRAWTVSAFPKDVNPYPSGKDLAKRFPKLWKRVRFSI